MILVEVSCLEVSLSAGTLVIGQIPHSNSESYIYGVAIRDTSSDGAIPTPVQSQSCSLSPKELSSGEQKKIASGGL